MRRKAGEKWSPKLSQLPLPAFDMALPAEFLNTEAVLKRAISNSKLPKVLDFNQSINVNMAERFNPACTSIPQEINHEDHQFSTGQHPPDTIDFSGDQNFGGDVEGGNSGGLYGTEAVVLTIEFLTDTASKWLLSMLHLGMVLGCIMLGVQLWWKISNDPYTLVYDDTILIINTSVCSFSLAALFSSLFCTPLELSAMVENDGLQGVNGTITSSGSAGSPVGTCGEPLSWPTDSTLCTPLTLKNLNFLPGN